MQLAHGTSKFFVDWEGLRVHPKHKTYTVMFIPHSESPTFSWQFPLKWVKLLGISSVFLASFCLILTYGFQQMHSEAEEYQGLLTQYRTQQEQLLFLAKQTENLQSEVQAIRELDATIRRMMKLKPNSDVTDSNEGYAMASVGNADSQAIAVSRGGLSATLLRTELSILKLQDELPAVEDNLRTSEKSIAAAQARQAATPSIWPTTGTITSGYGYRQNPFGWGKQFHSGLDIGARTGTPIYATAKGVINYSGYQSGYGYVVFINHGYGYSTTYAHMSKFVVKRGQSVQKGQLIGYVGSTGRSTGPHLHYEVRINGGTQNPINYLGR